MVEPNDASCCTIVAACVMLDSTVVNASCMMVEQPPPPPLLLHWEMAQFEMPVHTVLRSEPRFAHVVALDIPLGTVTEGHMVVMAENAVA